MLFDEADAELLKNWLIKKLESIDSEADADVLAEYTLALLKTDEATPAAKANCVDNLRDFLNEKADHFVDQLFHAVATQSYDPSKPPPKPAAPTNPPPRRASCEPPRTSKKRSYHGWERDEPPAGTQQGGGGRPFKQARRGGRGGRQQHGLHAFPSPPTPPLGMPPWDPANPLASLQAMYTAMGMMLPSDFPLAPAPPTNGFGNAPNRCRDYDRKGFCTRGATCPYEHGDAPIVVTGNEYDPANPGFLSVHPVRTGLVSTSPGTSNRGAHRGRGNPRGGAKRSHFSRLGPSHDTSNTSVVVEQIPEDKANEKAVLDFFGEFGSIEEVTLHAHKRLAVVRYDCYDAAKAAYDSPKVIFDNRFVKVYWYKDEVSLPQPPNGHGQPHKPSVDVDMREAEQAEPELDMERVVKQQEEAQRRHEEKRQKAEEAQKKKEEIEAQAQALEAQKRKILAHVAKREGKPIPVQDERTRTLREQLAKLEAEATTLGLDPSAATAHHPRNAYSSHGRGGYRGRAREGRGGYASYRGGWTVPRGGAVKRLDNRPKTVLVAFPDGTYEEHEEALRSWVLIHAPESGTLSAHPDRPDAALLAFPERYLAENFFLAAASPAFPLHGKLRLSWHAAAAAAAAALPHPSSSDTSGASTSPAHTHLPRARNDAHRREDEHHHEPRDLDVADEDERWG